MSTINAATRRGTFKRLRGLPARGRVTTPNINPQPDVHPAPLADNPKA